MLILILVLILIPIFLLLFILLLLLIPMTTQIILASKSIVFLVFEGINSQSAKIVINKQFSLQFERFRDKVPTRLTKSKTSRPINECPQMLNSAPIGGNFSIFGASYCSKNSKDWYIICTWHSGTRYNQYREISTDSKGTCRPDERCMSGSFKNGMPVAWCVSGNAYVHLSQMALANYDRVNNTNSTGSRVTNPNQSTLPISRLADTSNSANSDERTLRYLAFPYFNHQYANPNWVTCFFIGGSPERLVEARGISMTPVTGWMRGAGHVGQARRCSNCAWMTYAYLPRTTWKRSWNYRLEVNTTSAVESPVLRCVLGRSSTYG